MKNYRFEPRHVSPDADLSGQPPMIHGVWKTHEEAYAESGNVHGNSVMYISMPDHAGTHMDAPRHFGKSGVPMDEYPLEKCIVQGICLISGTSNKGRNYTRPSESCG